MGKVKYRLSEDLRPQLAKGFSASERFDEPDAAKKLDRFLRINRTKLLIAVGDVTSHKLIRLGRFPHICIIDGRTKRGKYSANWDWSGVDKVYIKNLPATISLEADEMIKWVIEKQADPLRMNRTIVHVHGEEDLLVLSCIKHAPPRSMVAYGMPDEGIHLIRVHASSKNLVEHLLEKMKVE